MKRREVGALRFFERPYAFAMGFGTALTLFTAFVLLDTFVIPHAELPPPRAEAVTPMAARKTPGPTPPPPLPAESTPAPTPTATTQTATATPLVTEDRYEDGNISVTLTTLRAHGTDLYVADVRLASAQYLRTALAKDTFGTNIKEKPSKMAERTGAVLAVNGDYYGADSRGYVIKNGVLYRDSVREDAEGDDLAIDTTGAFAIVKETEQTAADLVAQGTTQLFAFGPALVVDGEIAVNAQNGGRQYRTGNPRTAIGVLEPLHYLLLVSDGRTERSQGLTLLQLAEVLRDFGCATAYNLDGGGSSVMVFCGRVVNRPTTNGTKIAERAVSDIVYIGPGETAA